MNNLKKLAILCVMGVSCTAAAAACTTAEHTHTLEEHSANGATCTEAGNSAYWECGECHKYFSDADGETEIEENGWVIPASHTLTEHAATAAECTKAGNSAYWECTVCHEYFSDANGAKQIAENSWVIPAGHKWDGGVVTKTPAYDEKGVLTYTCSECGEKKTDEIPELKRPTVTSGAFDDDGEKQTSTQANSLMVNNNLVLKNGTLSVNLKPNANGDNGVIFGLSENYAPDLWEANSSYYFFFISQHGTAYLAKVDNGAWKVLAEQSLCARYSATKTYPVRVIKSGNNIKCYIEDVLYITYDDAIPLTGEKVGLRAQNSGVEFTGFAVNDVVAPDTADNLIIGSSVMELWSSHKEDLAGLEGTIRDIGIGGSQTSHWKNLIDEVYAYNPSRIIFYAGGNDLTGNVTPEQVGENYTYIFDSLKEKLPGVELIIITVHQSTSRNGANITKINGYAKEYAAAHSDWVKVADIENTFCDAEGTPNSLLFTDGLHLKPASYKLLANVVRETLGLDPLEVPALPVFKSVFGSLKEEDGTVTSTTADGNCLGIYSGFYKTLPAGIFSADIKAGEDNSNASYGCKNGIIFGANYNGETSYWNASGTQYYYYYIDAVSGELCLVKFAGGLLNDAQAALGSDRKIAIDGFDRTKTYNLKAEWDGVTVKCYLDGELKITFEDDEPYKGQYFGFRVNGRGTTVSGYTAARMSHAVNVPDAAEGGSVTADKTTAFSGEEITLTVSVESGFVLMGLTVNGTPVTVTDGEAKFIMPEGAAEISAEFARIYAISVTPAENGSVTAQPQTAKAGDEITLTVTPEEGYRVVAVTVNGSPVTVTNGAASFVMPAEEATVTAVFELIPPDAQDYSVTVGTVENGTVVADKTAAKEGETVTLTVSADSGYAFEELLVNGEPVAVTGGTASFTMPASDVTVTATFVKLYTVSVSADGGSVVPDKTEAKAGETVTVTVTPANGYKFISLSVNSEEIAVADGTATFEMPAGNVTLTAEFKNPLTDFTFTTAGNFRYDNGKYVSQNGGASLAVNNALSFTDGTLKATLKASETGDNGIIFGLSAGYDKALWETNGDYYFLFVNAGGDLILARVNHGWNTIKGVHIEGYSVANAYEVKVVKNGGRIDCYANGVLYITYNDPNPYAGDLVGYRAQKPGVEYGELEISSETPAAGISVKNGSFLAENGKITSKNGNSLAIIDGLSLGASGVFGVTVNFKGNTGDNGLVFGVNADCPDSFWENALNYYFPFIDGGAKVRLGRFATGWSEPYNKGAVVQNIDRTVAHRLEVVKNNSDIYIFVDGVCYFNYTDAAVFNGTAVGVRAGVAGIEYSDWSVTDTIPRDMLENLPQLKVVTGSHTMSGGVITTSRDGNYVGIYTANNAVTGTVSADIKAGDDNGNATFGNKNGIIFGANYNGEATYWSGTARYYMYYIDAVSGELCLVRFAGGLLHEEQAALSGDCKVAIDGFDRAQTYSLKVEWDGGTAKCYLNGELKITYTDEEPYTGGYVGIRANGPYTKVSGFKVELN